MRRDDLAREAKRIIDRIAAFPRAAGTEGERHARKYCADYLTRAGFAVSEEDFSYSPLPGKWGVPMVGLLALGFFVTLGAALDRDEPEATIQAAAPLLLAMWLVYLFARRLARLPRFFLRRTTNLVATRGGSPRLWLVAHLDSKSQPISMLLRIGGILLAAASLTVAAVVSFIPRIYNAGNMFWIPLTIAGIVGSVAVLLSVVGNRSKGAVDNASGVAAALLSAVEVGPDARVGVLLTSGEELGLVGAWAWVREQARKHADQTVRHAINFDGLDDVGSLTCMADGDNPLAEKLRLTASASRSAVTFRRVLPGLMVDANALNEVGWDAITLSKGDFSTLSRIHTPHDTPERLTGNGVAEAVELVTKFIKGDT